MVPEVPPGDGVGHVLGLDPLIGEGDRLGHAHSAAAAPAPWSAPRRRRSSARRPAAGTRGGRCARGSTRRRDRTRAGRSRAGQRRWCLRHECLLWSPLSWRSGHGSSLRSSRQAVAGLAARAPARSGDDGRPAAVAPLQATPRAPDRQAPAAGDLSLPTSIASVVAVTRSFQPPPIGLPAGRGERGRGRGCVGPRDVVGWSCPSRSCSAASRRRRAKAEPNAQVADGGVPRGFSYDRLPSDQQRSDVPRLKTRDGTGLAP